MPNNNVKLPKNNGKDPKNNGKVPNKNVKVPKNLEKLIETVKKTINETTNEKQLLSLKSFYDELIAYQEIGKAIALVHRTNESGKRLKKRSEFLYKKGILR